MYTLYKFHFLNGISEINQLFDDILIIWPAPVYPKYLSFIIVVMGCYLIWLFMSVTTVTVQLHDGLQSMPKLNILG